MTKTVRRLIRKGVGAVLIVLASFLAGLLIHWLWNLPPLVIRMESNGWLWK